MDSLIHISSALLGTDFMNCGRTLERLGLGGLTQRQIIEKMHS